MSQENVELVREGYEAFARGEIEFVLELMDEEVDWYPALAPLLGVGPVRGTRELEHFLTTDIPEGFTGFEAKAESIEDLGEAVLTRTRYSGVGRTSGVPVSLDRWSLFSFRGGKVVAFRDYESREEALEAADGRS